MGFSSKAHLEQGPAERKWIDSSFKSSLDVRGRWTLIEDSNRAFYDTARDMFAEHEANPTSACTEIGRAARQKNQPLDGVLYGTIERYVRGEISSYQDQNRPLVSFTVYLVDPHTGKQLWNGHYEAGKRQAGWDILSTSREIYHKQVSGSTDQILIKAFDKVVEQMSDDLPSSENSFAKSPIWSSAL